MDRDGVFLELPPLERMENVQDHRPFDDAGRIKVPFAYLRVLGQAGDETLPDFQFILWGLEQ